MVGFCFPWGTWRAWRRKFCLRNPRELGRQRQLASQRAQAFASEAVVDRYEALYREVLTKRGCCLDKGALTVLS
ncbi:MAG: hypothetical protein ACUVRY_01450 [Thermoanaerobaculaceae bacterium]